MNGLIGQWRYRVADLWTSDADSYVLTSENIIPEVWSWSRSCHSQFIITSLSTVNRLRILALLAALDYPLRGRNLHW